MRSPRKKMSPQDIPNMQKSRSISLRLLRNFTKRENLRFATDFLGLVMMGLVETGGVGLEKACRVPRFMKIK